LTVSNLNLKQRLATGAQLVVPGVFDALSAKVAADQGFEVVYMSGFAVAGSLLAKPDIGLVTASEMSERVAQIATAIGPTTSLIADGDNGYGNEKNVARLVQAYAAAGAQCIQLEDQVSPKRCGHMEGKEVVSLEEAALKVAAAVASRPTDDFLIMARTDARATHDLAEALNRGKAFLDAGADILFIEAPRSVEELETIRSTFPDTPLVANMVEDGKTPLLSLDALDSLGYQIVLRPVSALLAVTHCLQQSYGSLKDTGALNPKSGRLTFPEFNQFVGLNDE
jgi:2-methylisocitrate lyase-like PEP mutase family enzyme